MAEMYELSEQLREKVGHALKEAIELGSDLQPEADQRAAGKVLRKEVPRTSHATWQPAPDRPDPVELLRSQEASRVQLLLPIRHERMATSAFAFYRGSALIMASDLSGTPSTGIEVQACGDAHISNFGLYLSPERRTVFDINDFDETCRGPWEWDIKRLAASVEICGRDRGFEPETRKAAVLASVRAYRTAMESFSHMGEMDVRYAHIDADAILEMLSEQGIADKVEAKDIKKATKAINKSKAKDNTRAIAKLTEVVDGQMRIVSAPPLVVPLRDMAARVGQADHVDENTTRALVAIVLNEYLRSLSPERRQLVERYQGIDIAHKVVGVGSVGTRALIVVLQGALDGDNLVLQVKEAQESVLERFCGKSAAEQHGQRVVEGQRAMQATSDMLLGWCRLPDPKAGVNDFYVRQLWDGKGSMDLTHITARHLDLYAASCGRTLARAHARTGNRFAIAGYLGSSDTFDQAIARFAVAYADQNEADYQRFMDAFASGELEGK